MSSDNGYVMQNVVMTIGGGDSDTFQTRTPKAESIKTVKITKDNIKKVAALLVKAGKDVNWRGRTAFIADSLGFGVGDWVVEEYDYELSVTFYRVATLAEREKHDLR